MRITMTLSSLARAFAYFLGVRTRKLVIRSRNLKRKTYSGLKFRPYNLNYAIEVLPVRTIFRNYSFSNFYLKNATEDLRSILEPVQEGPRSIRYGTVKCKILHRVSVRNIFDAISTTESEEIEGELAEINTTHSSIIESDDLIRFK